MDTKITFNHQIIALRNVQKKSPQPFKVDWENRVFSDLEKKGLLYGGKSKEGDVEYTLTQQGTDTLKAWDRQQSRLRVVNGLKTGLKTIAVLATWLIILGLIIGAAMGGLWLIVHIISSAWHSGLTAH